MKLQRAKNMKKIKKPKKNGNKWMRNLMKELIRVY